MSLASWFPVSQLHRTSALNKTDRQSRRQPNRSRPSLEHLEERTLLDASSGLIGGSFNNPNLNNNFNLASSGNVLPVPGFTNFGSSSLANGANPQHALGFAGLANSGAGAEAASSTFLAQDQLYGQFRVFGVNSQGDSPRLSWRTTTFVLRDAYGFGSGSQPNAPWKPNAYNLGLANHQSGYPSQTDMGFSSVGPWFRRVAQSQPKDEKMYQIPSPNEEEEATPNPEQLAVQKSLREQEQPPQDKLDKDDGDTDKESKERLDLPTSEKPSPIETVAQDDGSLPDSLWLSVLSPAPMAALVAGLPGMTAAAEGGDVCVEAPE